MSNFSVKGLGFTQMELGLSTVVSMNQSKRNGFLLSKISGGSLCISGASMAVGTGFLYQEPITLNDFVGPLHLSAVGATVVLDVLEMKTETGME